MWRSRQSWRQIAAIAQHFTNCCGLHRLVALLLNIVNGGTIDRVDSNFLVRIRRKKPVKFLIRFRYF